MGFSLVATGDYTTPHRSGSRIVSIDFVDSSYHGDPDVDDGEHCSSSPTDGTTTCHRYCTAYVVSNGKPVTLALIYVRSDEKEADAVKDALVADGGREHCAECDALLPDEIEPGTGVYCPCCGTGQHVADGGSVDIEADDPLATFQTALLPNWCWEVYDIEEHGAEVVADPDPETGDHGTTETTVYFGQVKSPSTFGRWEVGRFTADELETAGAFRTDEDTGR